MPNTSSTRVTAASRKPTVEKLRRDAALLREHAAVVIVLNDLGLVSEVITRDPRAIQVVRLIVVLAPVLIGAQYLSETVIFELGFSRSRPYQQVERYLSGHIDFFIKPRLRVRKLTFAEYEALAPLILRVMHDMVFALRESWETKEAWEAGPKRVAYERGIFFTVHRSDTHAYAHFLKEDLLFREQDYFLRHVGYLRGILTRAHVQRVMNMTRKEAMRVSWVDKVAEHCASMRLPAIYVRELCKRLTISQWEALERIGAWHDIALPIGDAQTRLVDLPFTRRLPSLAGMSLVAKHSERSRQARNCFVVEAIFAKEYREHHEIPF